MVSLSFEQSGIPNTVRFVRVDDPSLLPLDNSATADPSDQVFGIDYSGGVAGALADMQAALDGAFGAGTFTLSDQGGDVLRVLDDGLAGTISITDLQANKTATGLQDGSTELPFFTDGAFGGGIYSGHFEGTAQKIGFAGRIQLNPSLAADSSLLLDFSGSTAAGNSARPTAVLEKLAANSYIFAPGDGGAAVTGSINNFITGVISQQGALSNTLTLSMDSRETAFNQLKERLDGDTKVNIDSELARLVELQTAYAANARIMSAVKEMMDTLLRI